MNRSDGIRCNRVSTDISSQKMVLQMNKPVPTRSPRLAQISSPWQQGLAPQHFVWFHWIGHPRKPPGRCKHLRFICHTSRLIGDFFANFGKSILGITGPKSKIKERRLVEGVMENWRPKNGSIPSRNKKESIWSLWQTDRQSTTKNNTLLGRRGDE